MTLLAKPIKMSKSLHLDRKEREGNISHIPTGAFCLLYLKSLL